MVQRHRTEETLLFGAFVWKTKLTAHTGQKEDAMKAREIMSRLEKAGHQAFLIGGAVRDMLLGLTPKDEDVVTSARPSEIIPLFRDCKVSEVGKSFGVVIINGSEVATFRSDRYEGFNDKAVEITYASSLKEDVARRDFTINAMAMTSNGEIIDYFNGRADLAAKVIRFVGIPADRIKEDPNRILRAFRFAAKINGVIAPESIEAIKESKEFVRLHVAPERIHKEILAAMTTEKPSIFFRLMQETGILEDVFPAMASCWRHEHGHHHAEDVFEHLMLAGDHAPKKDAVLRLAAFLHDVGKPETFDPFAGTFYDHEKAGAEILVPELRKLKFGNDEIARICGLVALHMRMLNPNTPKAARRLLRDMEDRNVSVRDMIRIAYADMAGRHKRSDLFLPLLAKYRELRTELRRSEPVHALRHLKIDGRQVMVVCGIKPSKQVGLILERLLQDVIDDPSTNTPKELECRAAKYARQ